MADIPQEENLKKIEAETKRNELVNLVKSKWVDISGDESEENSSQSSEEEKPQEASENQQENVAAKE